MLNLFRAGGLVLSACTLITWLVSAAPSQAQDHTDADLALVLLIDVSDSIDDDRWQLQRQGYADAFRSPEVIRAIIGGPSGRIVVTVVQWSDYYKHSQVVPWFIISGEGSSSAFAALMQAMARAHNGNTSISGALEKGMALLETVPLSARRRVIDISGDGQNNSGPEPEDVRNEAVARGIVINGLPIISDEKNIAAYYAQCVIGGKGSFIEIATSFETFGKALQKKLVREISISQR